MQEIELGVIARDVEPIFPDLVQTDNQGMKSMNYIGLIAPMIEAIKTQQRQIDCLKLVLFITFVLALASLAPTIYLICL